MRFTKNGGALSSVVTVVAIINDGGRALRRHERGDPAFFCRWPAASREGQAMSNLTDLIALSLVPSWWWRSAAELLRAGEPPGQVLDYLIAERDPDGPAAAVSRRSRAHA